MISCVIPAGANRPELLERALGSLEQLAERGGHETVVVDDAVSCGDGWNRGAARATGDYVWLLADDVELLDTSSLSWVLEACDAGEVICPSIFWPDGRLQGAGGFGRNFASGSLADNCIFPLMSKATWDEIGSVPTTNHYCDVYVTAWAREQRRGPVVVRGLSLSHAIVSDDVPGEEEAYRSWLLARDAG